MAKKSGKHLVIVESPAKAKTINRYLGSDYIVKASMGHIRDLPSKGMGVDLDTFEPEYVIIEERGKGKVVAELKKLARAAADVYLATDLDREGEAIAWHLKEALGIPDNRVKRVIFNAITKAEIKKAFENPHKIDMDRVNAQQARRILDRVVGYEISPLLWRKVARGLSAGRVQSVAVRLIVERERAIEAFIPEEYWKIGAVFTTLGKAAPAAGLASQWREFLENTGNGPRTKAEQDKWLVEHDSFVAELIEFGGEKFEPKSRDEALAAAQAIGFVLLEERKEQDKDARGPARNRIKLIGKIGDCPHFVVRKIETRRVAVRPPPPFITSTLQQAASSRLGFGAQRTMRAAQSLYESGRITYMRTDSTNLSADAVSMVRGFIKAEFGDRYLPESPNVFASSNRSAQEAHEAIRPTELGFTPHDAQGRLSPDESRLYQLIYNRFVACQMENALFDQTSVTIATSVAGSRKDPEAVFRATGRKLVFDGFMKVAGVSSEDQLLPALREDQLVYPIDIDPTQHFTQPPPRFTEASLVKELERLGIGRPSTYASIISVIQDRQYVVQIDRRFHATLLGMVVTDKLIEAFPEIMDVGFTADMEDKLDKIEEAHTDWIKLLRDFYGPLKTSVTSALETLSHAGGTESPYNCPKCGKRMLYRISKNGFFLACSDRACATTQPVDVHGKPVLREVSHFKCPNCGREMIKRRGRFGEFLGCSGYSIKNEQGEPTCATIINLDKDGKPLPPKPPPIRTTIACEKCGNPMLLRDSKRGPFLGCSTFPKCRSTRMVKNLQGDQLRQVEALLPLLREGAARSEELVAGVLSANPTLASGAAAVRFPVTTDIDCADCGQPMVIRNGRRGPFLGCSGYPRCRNTGEVPAKLLEELGLTAESKAEPAAAIPVEHEDSA